jgi:hypothetical protein
VKLPHLENPPKYLQDLLDNCNEFKNNIRAYNSVFAFTSLGASIDKKLIEKKGNYCFRIHGSIYHYMGSLLPQQKEDAKFAQIYIYDTDFQTNIRSKLMPSLDKKILIGLQKMFENCNPYVKLFRTIAESNKENLNDFQMIIQSDLQSNDIRRYNKPTSSDVAVIIPGDGTEAIKSRDIVIHKQNGTIKKISELNGAYDPLMYVLLFPYGDKGFELNIKANNSKKYVTMMEYYSYRLQFRDKDYNILHRSGRLFQQYIVDMYAKIEQARLNYFKINQRHIRAELYKGIQDVLKSNDTNLKSCDVGKQIILPASFIGGPRHMHQLYQDAMSIIRAFGKPDLFITFTCNPKWSEITTALLEGQAASDRPDLCARVFHCKLKSLQYDLFHNHVLGKVISHIHVIEYQKRGLPHAHFLIILSEEDKPRTPDDYDTIVSAEIPDQKTFPRLYEIVSKHMIHGPCGDGFLKAPCMKNGNCSKGYPKEFQSMTKNNNNGYPLYRRRKDNKIVEKQKTNLDNRWVVPYNPYLTLKYNAHINVEICSTVMAVKYLYKYVYKGHDMALLEITNNSNEITSNTKEISNNLNEIKHYIDGRYLSASEACWRIFRYSMHREFPNVIRLAIHLPNQQIVYFNEKEDLNTFENDVKDTTLTAWFETNKKDIKARNILYPDFPKYYTWNNSTKKWIKRKKNNTESIGRVYMAHPNEGEKYYLRMLLYVIPGATSFEKLRTVKQKIMPTFKEACIAYNLLRDDTEWQKCLEEGAAIQTPRHLRQLFASILLFCEPTNIALLWKMFKINLCEDISYRLKNSNAFTNNSINFDDLIENECLLEIQHLLEYHGKSLSDFVGMPIPKNDSCMNVSRIILEEISQNTDLLSKKAEVNTSKMNCEQKNIFDIVVNAIENSINKVFFIDGPGGTGKTFIYNTLLAYVRSKGDIALAVASSGIAALLLDGGRTAHSRFKIPLVVNKTSTCNISVQGTLAELIRLCKLVVWDEAPMCNKYAFEAVDRCFKDIMKSECLFGGKVVVLGGDFRQILPVIPHGTRMDIVASTLKRSYIWQHVDVQRLTINMRTSLGSNETKEKQQSFMNYLLRIGDGKEKSIDFSMEDELIELKNEMISKSANLDDFIDEIYPNISNIRIDSKSCNRKDHINS